jgi:hypothetical protein
MVPQCAGEWGSGVCIFSRYRWLKADAAAMRLRGLSPCRHFSQA